MIHAMHCWSPQDPRSRRITELVGQTLALILTFFVVMGGVVNFIVGYIISQVMVERKQNQQRRREYDARHKS